MHTLIASLHDDFEHLPGTDPLLRYHIPTRTTFEIVYDPDQAMLSDLSIFGFAARLYDVGCGQPAADNADELAAIGHDTIVALQRGKRRLFFP